MITTLRRMVVVVAAAMASLATAAPDVLEATAAAMDTAEVQLRPKSVSGPARLRSTLLQLSVGERAKMDLQVPLNRQGPDGQWSPVRCWMARMHAFGLEALAAEAHRQGLKMPGIGNALSRLRREMAPCFDDNHPSGRVGGAAAMRTVAAWLVGIDTPTLHRLDDRYQAARQAALSEAVMCAPGMCTSGAAGGSPGRALGVCLAILVAPFALPAAPELAAPLLMPILRRLAEAH